MINIANKQKGTWKWGLAALAILAPLFFLSYGFANHFSAELEYVPSMVFAWEHAIPLWPWTIVPYWSIDLFYGLSLLLCWNKLELKQHVLRLLSAQLIAVSCFLIFPLKFSFVRPELDGFFGLWFDVLMGFDQPYNQAPSLHIVLLVILWDFFRRHVKGHWKFGVDVWSFLIGLSVLTTWQHHFIDIPAGLLVGGLCLWLFPLQVRAPYFAQSNIQDQQHTQAKVPLQRRSKRHMQLAFYYATVAILLFCCAYLFKSWALWLVYPAVSLSLVALAYLLLRPDFFQKDPQGKMSAAALLLFAPYLLFAWLNSRLWTRQHPEDCLVLDHVQIEIYLGRFPHPQHAQTYTGLFDCCAELPFFTDHQAHQACYQLDLITIPSSQLHAAVQALDTLIAKIQVEETHSTKTILIFCALGYSRSSSILAAWLLTHQHAKTVQQAIEMIQHARPWIVLKSEQVSVLEDFHAQYQGK